MSNTGNLDTDDVKSAVHDIMGKIAEKIESVESLKDVMQTAKHLRKMSKNQGNSSLTGDIHKIVKKAFFKVARQLKKG